VMWLRLDPWLPPLATAVVVLLGVVVRCLALLIGLLVALSKAARTDRPDMFREYARSVAQCRIGPSPIVTLRPKRSAPDDSAAGALD
jgi:hypothetical protein